jgi:AraC family transcriptional regulator
MLPDQPLMLRSPSEYVSLYSRPPLVTSFATPWQGISMVHMHQPAQKLPEVSIPLHGIAIFTTSYAVEYTIDGKSQKDSQNAGEIVIIPKNMGHSRRLLNEADMVVIGLDPSLFDCAIADATHLHQTELMPHFPTPDPMVNQIGLSLKNVLTHDPIGSRLYTETTAAMLSVHLLQHYCQRKLEFKDYADGLPRSTLRRVLNIFRQISIAT